MLIFYIIYISTYIPPIMLAHPLFYPYLCTIKIMISPPHRPCAYRYMIARREESKGKDVFR